MTNLVDASSFTVPVAMFDKYEVEKNSLGKVKMERRFVKLPETVMERKIKKEDGIQTGIINLAISPGHPTDISDDKKNNPKSHRNFTFLDESYIRRQDLCR